MTDYYRTRGEPHAPRPRPSQPPPLQTSWVAAPSSRYGPSKQSSSTALENPPSPSTLSANAIKCSTCGVWVDLYLLGEHLCATKPLSLKTTGQEASDRRRRPDMRVNVEEAAPMVSMLSARTPDPAFLGPVSPLTPASRPNSPSYFSRGPPDNELSRSISSTSSLSSSASNSKAKLPFFERYQQMVGGKPGFNSTASMSRSGATTNLQALSGNLQTPPASPSPMWTVASSRSPSLSPSPSAQRFPQAPAPVERMISPSLRSQSDNSRSQTTRSSSHGRCQTSDLPYASSVDSHSSSYDLLPAPETPASSVVYGSPPRSRKVSLPSAPANIAHVSDFLDEYVSAFNHDHRATIKASQSTPSNLSTAGDATRSRSRQRLSQDDKSSNSGLDACLEDLFLMTTEDEQFNNPARDPPSHEMDESALATPRPSRRAPLPHSHSTPVLAGRALQSMTSSHANARPRPAAKPTSTTCTTCSKAVNLAALQKSGDGQVFCRPCYAERFLPKCRKCTLPIEGGAVTSSDGKVLGKYHSACFSCFSCSSPFPNKEFYVFDMKPYCQIHYHELNGSLCTSTDCGKPIEGPCVSLVGEENGGGGRYHAECFKCTHERCRVPLLEHHFVIGHLPYCERHAELYTPVPSSTARAPTAAAASANRARKRQTIITRR